MVRGGDGGSLTGIYPVRAIVISDGRVRKPGKESRCKEFNLRPSVRPCLGRMIVSRELRGWLEGGEGGDIVCVCVCPVGALAMISPFLMMTMMISRASGDGRCGR